jgi:taurine dioxygenase
MLQINTTHSKVGAIAEGVDVRNLSDGDFHKLYQAWLDRNVLVVRGQNLQLAEFLAYSKRFGVIDPHPSKSTRHPDCPEITLLGVNKFDTDGKLKLDVYRRGASGWHTDGAYDPVPFKATQLYGVAIPSRGGNTLFASMYAAYDALPARIKALIEGRRGAFVYGGRNKATTLLNPEDRNKPPAFHLLARKHPETNRTALYFDPGKILYIEGLAEEESNALIDELATYMVQPEAEYHHQWKKGDIVIWDNRCSYHKAAGDYPPEEDRIHWRVSIKERPVVH